MLIPNLYCSHSVHSPFKGPLLPDISSYLTPNHGPFPPPPSATGCCSVHHLPLLLHQEPLQVCFCCPIFVLAVDVVAFVVVIDNIYFVAVAVVIVIVIYVIYN